MRRPRKTGFSHLQLKDEVQATLNPLKPYVQQVRSLSNKALGSVKAAPRPYLWAAMGLIGWAAYKYYKAQPSGEPVFARGKDYSSEYTSEFPYQ